MPEMGEPFLHPLSYRGDAKPRRHGGLKGQIWMAPDFDETPPEVIVAFECERTNALG